MRELQEIKAQYIPANVYNTDKTGFLLETAARFRSYNFISWEEAR